MAPDNFSDIISRDSFNSAAQPDTNIIARQMGYPETHRQMGAVPYSDGCEERNSGSRQMGGFMSFSSQQMG